MAISSVNTYNAAAENAYATQKNQVSEKEKTKMPEPKKPRTKICGKP